MAPKSNQFWPKPFNQNRPNTPLLLLPPAAVYHLISFPMTRCSPPALFVVCRPPSAGLVSICATIAGQLHESSRLSRWRPTPGHHHCLPSSFGDATTCSSSLTAAALFVSSSSAAAYLSARSSHPFSCRFVALRRHRPFRSSPSPFCINIASCHIPQPTPLVSPLPFFLFTTIQPRRSPSPAQTPPWIVPLDLPRSLSFARSAPPSLLRFRHRRNVRRHLLSLIQLLRSGPPSLVPRLISSPFSQHRRP